MHQSKLDSPGGRGPNVLPPYQGLYSLRARTSYRNGSWSLGLRLFQSLWKLTGISAAALSRCLSNFRARQMEHPLSRSRDSTRFGGKTSYRLMHSGPKEFLKQSKWSVSAVSLWTVEIVQRYFVIACTIRPYINKVNGQICDSFY